MTLTKRVLCGLALSSLVTVPLAATLVTSAARPGNFLWTGTANTLIPLTSAGATSLAFYGSGQHVINYSAECETTGSWLSIQILLDGVPLAPTAGSSDAFCSDHNDNDSLDSWTTAHYTVATPALAAGVHVVQIQGTVIGATTDTGWLSDSSLVIER